MRPRMHLLLDLLVWAALTAMAALPGSAQSFTRLSFQDGKATTSGSFRFTLAEPDNPAKPMLWQGPLSIMQSSAKCAVDASLIHDVYLSATGRLLVVVSLSGSSTFVQFFDPGTCARKWPRLKAFTEGVTLQGNRLQLLPACVCPEKGKPCTCTAGSVYQLQDNTPPTLRPAASLALTKARLGVAFSGTRLLPRPPDAAKP